MKVLVTNNLNLYPFIFKLRFFKLSFMSYLKQLLVYQCKPFLSTLPTLPSLLLLAISIECSQAPLPCHMFASPSRTNFLSLFRIKLLTLKLNYSRLFSNQLSMKEWSKFFHQQNIMYTDTKNTKEI